MNKAQIDERINEAYTLAKQGKRKAAQQILRDVLVVDGQNVRAKLLLSHLVPKSEGIQLIKEILATNPNHKQATERLTQLQRQTRTPSNVPKSGRVIKLSSSTLLALTIAYTMLFLASAGLTVFALQNTSAAESQAMTIPEALTSTPLPATATRTPYPATFTPTYTPIPATFTPTPRPGTFTPTFTPTFTQTPFPSTFTPTYTPTFTPTPRP